MKTLFLMRHAKASPTLGNVSDAERPLLEEGRAAAERVGTFLKTESIPVDIAICSTAARAKETCEIVLRAAGIGYEVNCEQRIYDGGTVSLLEVISEAEDSQQTLLLVGHNPVLEDLVRELTGQIISLSPATLIEISLKLKDWGEVVGAKGHLNRVVRAKDLPSVD